MEVVMKISKLFLFLNIFSLVGILSSCRNITNQEVTEYVDILKLDGNSLTEEEINQSNLSDSFDSKNSNLYNKLSFTTNNLFSYNDNNSDNDSDEENNEDEQEHVHEYVDGMCSCGAHLCIQLGTNCIICGKHMHSYVNTYCVCGDHIHEYVNGYCLCGEKHPDYITENLIKEGQYVLLFKSEEEFSFTVKLNNPKAEAIDAIELTCDDPNLQIKVDGEYKNIQYQENYEGVKTRVVNWAQEDPYEKTFYIKSSSPLELTYLKIVDIKVNGKWQREELANDKLNIYKIEDDAISVKTVRNTNQYYEFNVVTNDKISDYQIAYNNKEVERSKDDLYRFEENGEIVIEFSYDFNGKKIKRRIEHNFELMSFIGYINNELPISLRNQMTIELFSTGFCMDINGTDLDVQSIFVNYENYTFEYKYKYEQSWNGVNCHQYIFDEYYSLPQSLRDILYEINSSWHQLCNSNPVNYSPGITFTFDNGDKYIVYFNSKGLIDLRLIN